MHAPNTAHTEIRIILNEERFPLDVHDFAYVNGMTGVYHSVNHDSVPEEIE
jgi:hypothetical protein